MTARMKEKALRVKSTTYYLIKKNRSKLCMHRQSGVDCGFLGSHGPVAFARILKKTDGCTVSLGKAIR